MIYHVVKQQTYILYTYDIDQSKSRFYSWSKLYHLVVFTAWSKWMDKHWSGKYVSYTYPAQSKVNRCPFYNLYSPKCWQRQLKLIFNSLHGTIGIINFLVGGGGPEGVLTGSLTFLLLLLCNPLLWEISQDWVYKQKFVFWNIVQHAPELISG